MRPAVIAPGQHMPLMHSTNRPDRPAWVNVYEPNEWDPDMSRVVGSVWPTRYDAAAYGGLSRRRLLYRIKVTPKGAA